MKHISNNTQKGALMARIVGSGEFGICLREDDKKAYTTAIYWNDKDEAIRDLKAIIKYFETGYK